MVCQGDFGCIGISYPLAKREFPCLNRGYPKDLGLFFFHIRGGIRDNDLLQGCKIGHTLE